MSKKLKYFAVAALAALLCSLMAGCGSGTNQENSAEKAEKVSIAEQIEDGREVAITDNYSYKIPKDAAKIDSNLDGKSFSNLKIWHQELGGGEYRMFRSFAVFDEPDCYPALADYLLGEMDKDAKFTDESFFDSVISTAETEYTGDDGKKLYSTIFFWPEGTSTLCSLEVVTSLADDDAADVVRESISDGGLSKRTSGASNADGADPEAALDQHMDEQKDAAMLDQAYDAMEEQSREEEEAQHGDDSVLKP